MFAYGCIRFQTDIDLTWKPLVFWKTGGQGEVVALVVATAGSTACR